MVKEEVSSIFKMRKHKAGSAAYYKEALTLINLVAIDYDGYNPNSAKQMRELVVEMAQMARDAINHKKLWIKIKGNNEKI